MATSIGGTGPTDLNGPAEIVQDHYARSIALANTAMTESSRFQDALVASYYQPAQIDVKWQTLPAPNLPPIPELPELPEISLEEPGGMPGAFNPILRDVQIDDFDVQMPELNFGQAPELAIGRAPALPQMREVAIPEAPSVTMPDAPQFLALQTHTFGGINLHEGWLDKLNDIPELSILQPAPFAYRPGAKYASRLLDNLKATLNARIHGGTGLVPAVEQQLWDRARDRETLIALAREQEVLRGAEALGFPLPSGVLAGQLADARREYHDKLSGLSRDISIKQAELEQANMRDTIQFALQLESTLLEDCYKLEMLAFEAAKAAADNAIAAHNAALEHFRALLAGYQAYAAAYDTIIKAELGKIEVFKALQQAEETKANINRSLVERYKAEIEGRMSVVEIYKARVGAAQTLVQLEGTRIQAGGEQIKAFVAGINAETAKADLYKTQVGAEATKAQAVEAFARAYSAKTGAQAEKARVEISRLQALLAAKGLEWDGYKTKLQVATTRAELAAKTSSILVDGYRVGATAAEAQANSFTRRWEADIHQYGAAQNLTFQVAKANADATTHANDMAMEAAKIGLTTSAQKTASAFNAVKTSAQIQGSWQWSGAAPT